MKKLILKMSLSLDGFVAGPKGESEWIFRTVGRDVVAWDRRQLRNVSLHLMGSRTYQDMAAWWPTSKDKIYAPAMNNIPKAIFSRRGVRPPQVKNTTASLKDSQRAHPREQGAQPSPEVLNSWLHPLVCRGNLTAEIKRLKRGTGKPLIAHGGASFASSLIESGLVDEFQLLVHPVLLGRGLPIFRDLKRPLDLVLVKSIPFRSGAVAQIYRPSGKP